MTGRTHDLAAFTLLSYVAVTQPLPAMSMATAFTGVAACFIGGLAPDIDQPTADLWGRLPAGSIIGKIFYPFFGGHRHISHSIVGVALFGFFLNMLLSSLAGVILVDMRVVWWAFMIGYISHLVVDMFTKEGVPWFFPFPWGVGIPPLRALRVQTGGFIEKSVLFPGLLFFNAYLYSQHYKTVLVFLRNLK